MARNTLRLYITADGKVAVKTFDEVGKASTRTADRVEKDSKRQAKSFALVEEGSHRLRGAVGTLAGTVGLAGLAFSIKDIIQAGQDWQTQQARLQQSLRNTGLYSQQLLDSINKRAEFTATRGGFAAPEQLQAMSQFIRLTQNATMASQANDAAMNLARGTGMDYATTQKMIGQALTGNVGKLQKYLGIIQPVKTAEFALSQAHQTNVFQLEAQSKALGKLGPLWLKQQEIAHNLTPEMLQHAQLLDRQATAQKILTVINQKYAGSMDAFSKTTAGAISNAKNAIDLAIEKLGARALPLVAHVAQGIASFVTYLSDHRAVLIAFGAALGAIGLAFSFTKFVEGFEALKKAVITFSGAQATATTTTEGLTVAEGELTVATVAWGAAMRATVIGIIITALYLLVTHFKQVKAVAIDVFHWVVNAAKDVWTWIKKHWMLAMLIAPFVALPIFVATHFKQVKHIVLDVVNFIWSKFKWVVDQIKHMVGGVIGIGKKIVHGAGSVLHDATFGLLHEGGVVRPKYLSFGGPIGTDTVPGWLTPGEFVLRREAVQQIGVQNLNAINQTGNLSGLRGGNPDEVYVAAPLIVKAGQRVLTETTVHFAAKKMALSGAYSPVG